jgi:hypothetical protein
LTIAPDPWLRIWASWYFMLAQIPRRLMPLTRSKVSAVSSAASLIGDWMPALLYARSRLPNVSTVLATAAATCCSSATSHRTAKTRCPASSISRSAVRSASSLMSTSVTAAPASANARAVASPMPELAPVTNATCPEKS